jgi:hypothetical protein
MTVLVSVGALENGDHVVHGIGNMWDCERCHSQLGAALRLMRQQLMLYDFGRQASPNISFPRALKPSILVPYLGEAILS